MKKRRCDCNRRRSKRRTIYCPIHGCYLDSVSQKHSLFADTARQLQQRNVSHKNALMLIAHQTVVPLEGEWLEAFWCDQCQETTWYHVCKTSDRTYTVRVAPRELWQQVQGVIQPSGNPSVGEFTRRQSRMLSHGRLKDYRFMG